MGKRKNSPCSFFSIDAEIENKVDDLIEKMTLDEKIGQMYQTPYRENGTQEEKDKIYEMIKKGSVGSLFKINDVNTASELQGLAVNESRLGIPLIIANDVIHGCHTAFPIPLAQACSWDMSSIEEAEAVAAREAASTGTHWVFAPMLDVARDPRWGRITEGSGEDTYLGAKIAQARVKGFQRNDWSSNPRVACCPKHLAAYGASEGGRDCNAVDMSERTLREVYLPPFKAAIDAGAGTIMTGYHDFNGVPVSVNKLFLNDILRNEWGFKGIALSDWQTILDLMEYGVTSSLKEAAEQTVNSGQDMDMASEGYLKHLADLVGEGKVSEQIINEAVRRILRVKFWLGLFETPFTNPDEFPGKPLSKEHLDIALDMSRKSIVLLKNQNNTLPLNKNIKSVAVIGPFADNQKDPLGTWNHLADYKDVITVLEAVKVTVSPNTNVYYSRGCDINSKSTDDVINAVETVKKSDAAIVVLGESADMSGEGNCRAYLDLPGKQEYLLNELHKTGTPIILVLMNGRPLSITWAQEHIEAIVEAWHLGLQSGRAISDIIFGDYNPSGKLPVTFPRTVGQIPVYYNDRKIGGAYKVKYFDVEDTPLYPFGYGLSYTSFKYSNLTLSSKTIGDDDELIISIDIENTGIREGDEIVQLYIHDVVASSTRPVKELKGFERINLKPKEKKTIRFTITTDDLKFYNQEMKYIAESGVFELWVGPNSAEGLKEEFCLI
jgi:beta-glucosidase